MFLKTLRGKKNKAPDKEPSVGQIRLVTSGEVKHESLVAEMPPPEELKREFAELLVCT
jgi:hypothetical protein